MAWRDATAGIVMIVLSLVLFVGTWDFAVAEGYVSPRVFPRIVAGILFVFSTILLARAAIALWRDRAAAARSLGEIEWSALRRRYTPFAGLVAVSWLYIGIIPIVGYPAATIGLIAVAAVFFGERRWWVAALVAVASGGTLYALFRYVFLVPLPRAELF